MSDSDKLAPMPEPSAEEPQLFPGGVDAIDDEEKYGALPDDSVGRDLPPEENPANEVTPPEIIEPDDKQQESDGGSDAELGTESEAEDDKEAAETAERTDGDAGASDEAVDTASEPSA